MNLKPSGAENTPTASTELVAPADLALASAAAAGEPAAMERILERLACIGRILSVQNEQMGRPLSALDLDDVGQDVRLLVLRKLSSFEGRSSLESWIFRICQIEILSHLRKRRRTPTLDSVAIESAKAVPVAESDVLAVERVLRLLEELPSDSQRIIRMKHFDMLTFEEIAEQIGASSNTAKTTYYRALFKLRQRFRDDEFDGGRDT